jgi:peptide/nickel transport system substrate-binding protein
MSTDEYQLIDEVLSGTMSRRDLIKRLLAAGVSVSAVAGLLYETGLGGEAEAASVAEERYLAPKRGGAARFGTVVPAADVDPITLFNEGAIFNMQLSCEYLCFPRPNGSLQPKLATSWKSGKTPNVWTFNLRQGVKWHDGSAFTADDVVATFKRLADPKNNSAGALAAFKGVFSGHITKINSHQVQFHLDRPYVDFPYLVSAFNYNSVVLPKNYKVGDFVKGRVGTGPFVLTKYTPKVGSTYTRNTHYWAKGLPYLNGAEMKFYADQTAIVLALQAGAIDAYLDMPYQGSQAVFGNSNIKVLTTNSSAYREFHMRVDQKPFTDKRVRQAVALSLDRKAIIQGLWRGFAAMGNDHGFAPNYPVSALAVKDISQRKQNYTQAKKLLAQAGYSRGFSATLTTENFLEIPQYAVIIQQQLKGAGIDVKLNVEDQNTYYGTGANQPWLDVPFGIVDWAGRGAASQTINAAYLCGAVWNSAHWCNKKYDTLLNRSDRVVDPTQREKIALQAAKIQNDEVPAVITYWIKELRGVRKNVHGLASGPAPHVDPSAVWLG